MVEGARHLVAGEVFAGEVFQAVGVEGGAVFKHDARNDVLGAVRTRAANYGNILDVRVAKHDFLHLSRVHVEAAGDNQLLDARDQAHEAVFLHHTHVAGAEPAVVERDVRVLRVVQVAGEHLRALGQDLAGFAGWHVLIQVLRVGNTDFRIGEGDTDISRPPVSGARVTNQNRAGFGQAVAFHQVAAGERLPVLNDIRRQ